MTSYDLAWFQREQERAKEARRQAVELRELYHISRCGLIAQYDHHHGPNKLNCVNYGTYRVPTHIALRMSDMYPIWADEYDAVAEEIERRLADAIRPNQAVDR